MAGPGAEKRWQRLDTAASGLICGAIIVLAVLMTAKARPPRPIEGAVVVFGSTLAITLSKALSSRFAEAPGFGARITRQSGGLFAGGVGLGPTPMKSVIH